jgi:ubiquinone biosynthesis protein UbiJ
MVLNDTNRLMDEYEQDVDEIIATCRGDLRGAVKALMLINERLEQTLRQLSAVLVEKAGEDQSPRRLH